MTGQRRAPAGPRRITAPRVAIVGAYVALFGIGWTASEMTGPIELSTQRVSTTPATAPASTPAPQLLPPEPVEVPSTVHAVQTCARIADESTADGVWDAALALELPPLSLPVEAAWAAVDTFVRIDCPEHAELVAATIAAVTE